MKWIGQHIWDFISRFRSDVYLEATESGTIASGGNLGLDSNNKVVKQADTGITDLTGAGVNGADNQLLTDDGDGTVTSETYATFVNTGNVSTLSLLSNEDTGDLLSIATTTHGATTITTTDDDGGDDADLTFNVGGFTKIDGLGMEIENNSTSTEEGLFIDNNALGQIALKVDSGSGSGDLTADALTVTTDSGTNVDGVFVNTQGTATASHSNSGIFIDYDKSVNMADGQAQVVWGIKNNVDDNATGNHSGSTTSLYGILNEVDYSTTIGDTNSTIYGVYNGITGADTQYGIKQVLSGGTAATTYGLWQRITDGGTDLYFQSSDTTTVDYFSIATGASGATTISTVDGDAHAADLTFSVDGFTKFTSPGITGGGVEIENASASGAPALLIDNDVVDQAALSIDAANITVPVVDIRGQALTTGGLLNLAGTATPQVIML